MFFSRSPTIKLLAAIVGPSISCGIFLGVAIMSLEKEYTPVLFLGAVLLLAGAMLIIAVQSCKKVLELIP